MFLWLKRKLNPGSQCAIVERELQKIYQNHSVMAPRSTLNIAVKMVWETPDTVKTLIQDEGRSPKDLANTILMNFSAEDIRCGHYHIYRGVLGISGNGLLQLWISCLDNLVELDVFTEQERNELIKEMEEDIAAVG